MDTEIIKKLETRNARIIDIVLEKIAEECPGNVDLFGVGGSFCSGDFYEKSDLDLVLISKTRNAPCLDKCFILDDIGFDIYSHDFKDFDEMALYPNPYVAKLIDLDIIETSEFGRKHYEYLQEKLKMSMSDDEEIRKNIKKHFKSMLCSLDQMKEASKIGFVYRMLAEVIKYAEYIIYMSNKAYVKGGVKRIPSEIADMQFIPEGFMEIYHKVISLSDIKEIKNECRKLVEVIRIFLGYEVDFASAKEKKDVVRKKSLKPANLIGTYEEIYSNWYNKMIHASTIDCRYLSFVTMASCQEFYDEMFDEFEVPQIELIDKYNPFDLGGNVRSFESAMAEWKKNYRKLGIEVCRYDNLHEFKRDYLF